MIVQNLQSIPDNYGAPVVSLSAMPISLFVFNNAIRIIVLKKNPGGGQDWERTPEQVIAPGSCQITGAVGFLIKNATAGRTAIISYAIPEFQKDSPDPSIIGYTPNTLSVTASGIIVATASPSYYKNGDTVDITTPSGNVETDLINFTIKAVDVGVLSKFKFEIVGDFLNAAVTQAGQWRAYIGATKVFDTGLFSFSTFGANRQAYTLRGSLTFRNALNSQWTEMGQVAARGDAAPPTVGEGGQFMSTGFLLSFGAPIGGGSAVDMTVDQIFRVTFAWGVSDANHSYKKFGALAELY